MPAAEAVHQNDGSKWWHPQRQGLSPVLKDPSSNPAAKPITRSKLAGPASASGNGQTENPLLSPTDRVRNGAAIGLVGLGACSPGASQIMRASQPPPHWPRCHKD